MQNDDNWPDSLISAVGGHGHAQGPPPPMEAPRGSEKKWVLEQRGNRVLTEKHQAEGADRGRQEQSGRSRPREERGPRHGESDGQPWEPHCTRPSEWKRQAELARPPRYGCHTKTGTWVQGMWSQLRSSKGAVPSRVLGGELRQLWQERGTPEPRGGDGGAGVSAGVCAGGGGAPPRQLGGSRG